MTALEAARALADAVLYEGYVLYPYRASAVKNQVRWQWGVLMPPEAARADPSERASNRTDVVVDGRASRVRVTVRFLQVQRRSVEDVAGRPIDRLEVGDAVHVPWDEAVEREVTLDVPLGPDADPAPSAVVDVAGGSDVEELPGHGRLIRVREPLQVSVSAEVRRPPTPTPVAVVSVRVANATALPGAEHRTREDWLRHALVACHLLLEVEGARFLSLLDPPEWAAGLAAECEQDGVFPVLAAPDDTIVLSSPIILYDHAELAPESETGFFDGLEIDELLSLRTMTLSEEERREIRGTDPRAAALLGEVDAMPAELWDRLHGTVRYLDKMTAPDEQPPWWDPGADATVDPEHDSLRIGEVDVCRGSRVLLRPGARRADAHDLFLAGRTATVAAVLHDVDGQEHLAVTVDDDPGRDLKDAHGRYLYFAPDEVEPVETAPASPPGSPAGDPS